MVLSRSSKNRLSGVLQPSLSLHRLVLRLAAFPTCTDDIESGWTGLSAVLTQIFVTQILNKNTHRVLAPKKSTECFYTCKALHADFH